VSVAAGSRLAAGLAAAAPAQPDEQQFAKFQ
jgi:hypothetical protein